MRVLILLGLCFALALSCERGTDCPTTECCLIGKDGVQTCQPLAAMGEACHMLSGRLTYGQPDFPVTECPCAWGFHCIPNDPSSPAILGAEGTCQALLLS